MHKVNLFKYKDNRTRFFISAVVRSCQIRALSTLLCSLHPLSENGEHVYVNKFFVYQVEKILLWWMKPVLLLMRLILKRIQTTLNMVFLILMRPGISGM
ncbi:hypothetical protein SOVF_116690 [Spinacia oleracea]|nr:hypothetical protein SOVF_116690 [Spinacia oleracea]